MVWWSGLALLLGWLAACAPPPAAESAKMAEVPQRIVSFAPSITETLFALGVGERVVGVTRYCTYPAAVAALPQVGGTLDPQFEQLLGLKPDLVLTLKEDGPIHPFLQQNGIRCVRVDNASVAAILASITQIGEVCAVPEAAARLVREMTAELGSGVAAGAGEAPTVLFCIGRNSPGAGSVTGAYVAGPQSAYDELMQLAGGRNVVTGKAGSFLPLSSEGIARLNPAIIIELLPGADAETVAKAARDWETLRTVAAVRNRRVHLITSEYAIIPGPRITLLLRELRRLINPAAPELPETPGGRHAGG